MLFFNLSKRKRDTNVIDMLSYSEAAKQAVLQPGEEQWNIQLLLVAIWARLRTKK